VVTFIFGLGRGGGVPAAAAVTRPSGTQPVRSLAVISGVVHRDDVTPGRVVPASAAVTKRLVGAGSGRPHFAQDAPR
jgi:hypothetical protein